MNEYDQKGTIIRYWLQKSSESLAAAHDDLKAGRLAFAVGRAYYACFYSLSAVLLNDGHRFKKHSGVRNALQRYYVKTGQVTSELGRFYNRLFDSRQRADYQELVVFEREQVDQLLEESPLFVDMMKSLLPKEFGHMPGSE